MNINVENEAVNVIKKESTRYLLECYVCSENKKSYKTAIDNAKNLLDSKCYNSKWPSDFCDLLIDYYFHNKKDLFQT